MNFELATDGILAWLGRLITDRIVAPSEVPRGLLIVMLAVGCWLAMALVVWLAIYASHA